MSTTTEYLPTRPRRSSAGRRRRNHTQLPYRLQQIVPGADTILVTPMWAEPDTGADRVFMVLVWDRAGARIALPPGATVQITAWLQGAFAARWEQAQTWHAAGNTLTERRPPLPRAMGRWTP